MSDYELYNADCLEIFGQLAPQSVDAIICDPPYGTTACKWDSVIPFAPMWAGIKRVLKPRGACVLFGSQPFTSALVISNAGWFRYEWVWDKRMATGHGNARIMPMRAHESIVVFGAARGAYYPQMIARSATALKRLNHETKATGAAGVYRTGLIGRTSNRTDAQEKYPASVIRIAAIDNFSHEKLPHPTQKPLALLEYLVKTYTNAGDTVLDFAMGSGTTGHACGNLDRRFVGIEKDAGYFDIASERIATAYAPLRHMQTEDSHARI